MITFKRFISILLCAVLLFSLCSCAHAATKIVPADSESGETASGTHYIVNKNTQGYKEMVLDTVIPLKAAISLYRKNGFTECEPYYDSPMDDVIYMSLQL